MLEIKGKYNTAIVYAKVIEEEAITQIQRMCDYEFCEGAKIRIMSDVHAGKGCTIGTTMSVVDKVVPNIVGVDIGCGMYTVPLKDKEINFKKLDETAHYIPSGKNVWKEKKEDFDLTQLRCYKYLKNKARLVCSLGTLGGGNHFIEVDRSKDGTLYLIIHSGSRNLGKQVAEYYQKVAVSLQNEKDYYFEKRDAIIEEYRKNGKEHEIQKALDQLVWEKKEVDIPDDLCFLHGTYLEDYLHDVKICQQFAKRNREKMAEILMKLTKLKKKGKPFHTVHNYIDTDEMILRKGAIAAHKDEIVLIPINMRDGSVLAKGKGNAEWNFSAPHGAGRILSRSKAKQELSMKEYKKAMEGVYTTSISSETLDESPMAYKSLEDIIDVIDDSVEIIDVMKPIYNFKASE